MEANLVFDCPRCGWRMFGDLTHGYGEIECKGCEKVILFVVKSKQARIVDEIDARAPFHALDEVDALHPVYVDYTLRRLFLPVTSPRRLRRMPRVKIKDGLLEEYGPRLLHEFENLVWVVVFDECGPAYLEFDKDAVERVV